MVEKVVGEVVFIIVMSSLYYFKRNDKRRSFDVGSILEWDGIIDKVNFWEIKGLFGLCFQTIIFSF